MFWFLWQRVNEKLLPGFTTLLPESLPLYTRFNSYDLFWDKVECYKVAVTTLSHETFCHLNSHFDPLVISAFGTPTPDSSLYLLHHTPKVKSEYPPVLLVHGAAANANCWTIQGIGGQGLARQLHNKGFDVFAITFSHPHGDNRLQALQLADAVERICCLTGSETVNLVAHSKGGIACRAWLQGLSAAPLSRAVKRICFLGVPNLGTDFVFRYPSLTLALFAAGFSVPVPYEYIKLGFAHMDMRSFSVYRTGTFKGQAQMLKDLSNRAPLNAFDAETRTVYHGGDSILGYSPGIERAINDGGQFIDQLNSLPFPSFIDVAFLAGTTTPVFLPPQVEETESDGLVFVESALFEQSFVKGGCKILARDLMPVDHLEMLYSYSVGEWIASVLTMP